MMRLELGLEEPDPIREDTECYLVSKPVNRQGNESLKCVAPATPSP